MSTLGERIVQARAARRLRQTQLAAHFGIRPVSVHQWEAGHTRPDAARLPALAEVLGVSLDWLLSGRGDMGEPEAAAAAPPSGMAGYVPVKVADVRPGMGGPGHALQGGETGVEYIPASLIASLRAHPDDLWIMQVEGQSMSPTLEAGDTVLVDGVRTNPSQPGIFVVWDGFGMVCKWVERVIGSDPPAIRLVSQNPMFQPVELTVGEPGEAEAYIMGRVVWMSRTLN